MRWTLGARHSEQRMTGSLSASLATVASLLALTVTTQTVVVPSASAATVLFAFAAGGAPASQTSCPASSVVPERCSLALALSLAGPGDTVELATPGGGGVYRGNWRVSTESTSAARPVTIEPASPGTRPVLSGNGGQTAGCGTPSCDGPVLTVGAGVHLDLRDVVINDASNTTSGGAVDNADENGTGTLTVSGSTFSNDFAVNADGGAIANADMGGTGQVSVTDSSFYDDGALSGDGGAIDNGDTGGKGTLVVTGSVFEQNAAGRAGAIGNGDNASGTLTVASSSFVTDVAATDDAGAIDNADWGGHATAHITTSTFFGDDTTGNGGAIDNADSETTSQGTIYISDSTLYGKQLTCMAGRSTPATAVTGPSSCGPPHCPTAPPTTCSTALTNEAGATSITVVPGQSG